jgi:hypothetical protein
MWKTFLFAGTLLSLISEIEMAATKTESLDQVSMFLNFSFNAYFKA